MADLIRLGIFAAFAGLAIATAIAAAGRSVTTVRRTSNLFIAFTLAVSFSAGLLQRDLWPFTNWPLVAGIHPGYSELPRLVVVDRAGREHEVDYRAWEPLIIEELLAFARRRLPDPRPGADRIAEHLLGLAEASIARVRRGGPAGVLRRTLGPLAAPSFLLHPVRWNGPGDLPPAPLIGLRLYLETWNLEERLRSPDAVERRMVYEYLRR